MAIPPDLHKVLMSTPALKDGWIDMFVKGPPALKDGWIDMFVKGPPALKDGWIDEIMKGPPPGVQRFQQVYGMSFPMKSYHSTDNIIVSPIDSADRRYMVEQARNHTIRFVTTAEYLTDEINPRRKSLPLRLPNEVFFCSGRNQQSMSEEVHLANRLLMPVLVYVSKSFDPPDVLPVMGGVVVVENASVFRDRWKTFGRVIKDSMNQKELFDALFGAPHLGPIS